MNNWWNLILLIPLIGVLAIIGGYFVDVFGKIRREP